LNIPLLSATGLNMINYRLIYPILLIFTTLLFNSCNPDNDKGIPSYIHIEKIDLVTTPLQGTASHKIVDAWVYIDNKLIGAFELPATFPVLRSGNTEIKIYAGIKINGIAAVRSPYPFYKPIFVSADLIPERIDTLRNLTTTYEQSTTFEWLEDFDSGALSIDTTSLSATKLHRTSDPSLIFKYKNERNDYSAMATLSGDSTLFECATIEYFELPKTGTPVFLEMNYKNDFNLTVGLIYITSTHEVHQHSVLILNPTEEWNKVYINFTPTISVLYFAQKFKVFIGMMKNDPSVTATIYLDNLKLVY